MKTRSQPSYSQHVGSWFNMPGVEGRLFDGDNDAVAAVISPFAPVPDFVLLYGTAMHKTPLDIPMLMKYKGLLRAVFRIHHRLTFAEKDMTVILYTSC